MPGRSAGPPRRAASGQRSAASTVRQRRAIDHGQRTSGVNSADQLRDRCRAGAAGGIECNDVGARFDPPFGIVDGGRDPDRLIGAITHDEADDRRSGRPSNGANVLQAFDPQARGTAGRRRERHGDHHGRMVQRYTRDGLAGDDQPVVELLEKQSRRPYRRR